MSTDIVVKPFLCGSRVAILRARVSMGGGSGPGSPHPLRSDLSSKVSEACITPGSICIANCQVTGSAKPSYEATGPPFPLFPSSKSCAGILHMRSSTIISIRHVVLSTGTSSTVSHHEQAEEVLESSPGLVERPHVHWYAVIRSKA